MRVIIGIVATLLVVGAGFVLLGNSGEAESAPRKEFEAVQRDLQAGARLYDVRTREEFAAGHFAGAVNWPNGDIQAGKLPNVPKDTKMYVYCRSGNRSSQSAAALRAVGFSNIVDLHGLADVQAIGGQLVGQS